MLLNFVVLLSYLLLRHANAIGVKITDPAPGATFPAGPLNVTWMDAGGSPNMSALATFDLQLIVGGIDPDDSQSIQNLTNSELVSKGSVTGVIDANVAQSAQNAFYLKMVSMTTDGNQVINYSDRFTLINMNGTTSQVYLKGANDAPGASNVPIAQYNVLTPPESAAVTPTSSAPNVYITVTATSSPSSSATSTDSIPPINHGVETIVGMVIVGLVCIAAVAGFAVWIALRRERKKKQNRDRLSKNMTFQEDEAILDKPELPATSSFDSHASSPGIELPGGSELHRSSSSHEKAVEIAEPEAVFELEGDWSPWEAGPGRRSRAWDPTA